MNGYRSSVAQQTEYQSGKDRPSFSRGATFTFRKRWGQIDWRSLASVDVDKIAQEMDLQALQHNIMNIAFCNIASEEFHNVDTNFIKLFRLAQLIIEYLLHCQQYLSEQGSVLEQKQQETQQELESVQRELTSRLEELKAMKKESKKRRKVIEAYQDMMNAGATGLHACPVCSREFVSAEYLQSHIHRRHPDHYTLINKKEEKKPQEELEQRLLEQMNEKLRATEEQLRLEITRKEQEASEIQTKEFEEWKQREQERMKRDMDSFKAPILAELRVLQQEKAEMEEVLQQKQVELEAVRALKQSHLGHLEGSEELDLTSRATREKSDGVGQLKLQVGDLQMKLKKQEKSWQKKIQKLSTSYQDQRKESVVKMQTLEQSLHDTIQQEKQLEDSHVTKEIRALQQKMKRQEQQLSTQQRQLTDLCSFSREPSPAPHSITPASYSPDHSRVVPLTLPTEEESYSEEGSEVSLEEVEEVDARGFAPFPHRPMITTHYDHRPEVLGNIKKETQGILADALVQRGLAKTANGLTTSQFEEKVKSLETERQQRIQTHYNFLEHRDRLEKEVEDIAAANCVFEPPLHQKKHSQDLGSSLPPGGRSSSKPPKPITAKLSASLPVSSGGGGGGGLPVMYPKGSSSHIVTAETQAQPVPVTNKDLVESEGSGSPWETEEEEESSVSGTASPHHPHPPSDPHSQPQTSALLTGGKMEEGSPWDSEDDSIEELAVRHLSGRASSTPIKRISSEGPQVADKIRSLAASVDLEPDRSKRPPGGVPLFVQPKQSTAIASDSDDSFDITESSNAAAPPHHKREAHSNKPVSRTATSRSALTTVSVGDFDDSDLSDLEITRLT